MTANDIITRVKNCIDEVKNTNSAITSVSEETLMNGIILSHLSDALGWCVTYAPNALGNATYTSGGTAYELVKDYDVCLSPGTGSSINVIVTKHSDNTQISNSGIKLSEQNNASAGTNEKYAELTLPASTANILRVRHASWHKAINKFISEDSDEYLELRDSITAATNERPVAALINSNPVRVELYPAVITATIGGGLKINVTFVDSPSYIPVPQDLTTEVISLPTRLMTSFIYYLSFLVLSAYNDISKANQMLAIAKMSIGAATQEE